MAIIRHLPASWYVRPAAGSAARAVAGGAFVSQDYNPPNILDVDGDNEIYAGQQSIEVHGVVPKSAATARIVSGDQYVYVKNFTLTNKVKTVTLPGGRGSWRVPGGVHSIAVVCTGAGGNSSHAFAPEVICNGGAGGACSFSTLAVTPGQLVYYNCPRAKDIQDSWVNIVADAPPADVLEGVLAEKGGSSQPGLATPGGQASNGIGQVKYSGASLPAPEPYYDEVESVWGTRVYYWGAPAENDADGTYYNSTIYIPAYSPSGFGGDFYEEPSFGVGSSRVVYWLSDTSFSPPRPVYPGYGGVGLVVIQYTTVEIGFDAPTLAELLDNGIKLGSVTFEIVK
jgi:hypothetical protein